VNKSHRTLVRDGARLAVTDWGGDGPPVLLVHGLTGSQREWDAVAAQLADRCRVITYDQRCHGRSRGSADHSWSGFVGDLEAVIDDLELGDITLVGHSFGAAIALEVAVGNEACRALALLDGAFPVPEPQPSRRRARMFVRTLVMRAKWIVLRPFHRVHSLSSSDLRQVGNDYRSRSAAYESAQRALECPTIVLLGSLMENGRNGPAYQDVRREAARIVASNPGIDVQWIEARHDMILTHAPEIAERIFRLRSLAGQ
jgi:pimeloyl-ACP methyl ester carboxylesterase